MLVFQIKKKKSFNAAKNPDFSVLYFVIWSRPTNTYLDADDTTLLKMRTTNNISVS